MHLRLKYKSICLPECSLKLAATKRCSQPRLARTLALLAGGHAGQRQTHDFWMGNTNSHTLQARHTRAACRAACRTSASSSRWHSTYGTRMKERWGGSWGNWRLCYLKWIHVFFFSPMVHSLVRSSRRWTGNVPVQNSQGCFPTLFILVLLPEGEGFVRLSSKTSCSGPQLFSSQQNKGSGKFINVRYAG